MMLLCLILFGILQVSYLVASRNVIHYAAIATARAASVGLNDFMLHKVSHYASIPTAGPVTTPSGLGMKRLEGRSTGSLWENAIARDHAPVSELGVYEVDIKEAYHMAGSGVFRSVIDYENWKLDGTDVHVEYERDTDDLITLHVEQTVPLVFPFAWAFFGHLDLVDAIRGGHAGTYPGKKITATAVIEDHSEHYLKNN
jgi:hypothetical protein